jgi:hypothetical protein
MQDQIDSSSTPAAPVPIPAGPFVAEPKLLRPAVPDNWFYRAEQALGLISPSNWSITQRIAILIAIGWLPLLLITALTNPTALHSLLIDGRVHVRALISIPALLVGELMIQNQISEAYSYLRQGDFLDDADLSYMEDLTASIGRLANAAIPQLVVFVLVILRIVVGFDTLADTAPWFGERTSAGLHFTAAGWYTALVSMPLWVFLLGMTFWGWLLWVYFVFQLSRRKLRLVASHPDKQGGLGFLGLSASGFAPIAFALCFSIAATWRHEIVHHGAHLMDFKFHAIVLAVCIAVIAAGPLIFFVPRLTALRRSGILDYGVLGQFHSTRYHQAWIRMRGQQDTKTLLAPENNTILNFGKTYDNVGDIQVFPATKSSFYPLVMAIIIPGVYAASAEIPFVVILKDLLHALK